MEHYINQSNQNDSDCISPYNLVTGKKYSVNTSLGQWKGTIKGTFSRYEKNKIIGKDVPVSIVLMDWWGESNGRDFDTEDNPCRIQLYLDPIENLAFYEIE